ncbi:MAG TPA: tetratricopeptide repeat protein [Rhodanobacteraceae bacterium]|jgi:predicted O-linked N-acetylglucosamine transferase (SPINDLY family)|nr:tetratricopeptide repeat protein [Rhodanobacteraceae bacterium]
MASITDILRTALDRQRAGALADAEALYREVLADNPDHVDALQMLATVLHQLGRPADALALFDRALALAPAHAGVLANRAAVELDCGEPARAAADAQAALTLDPTRFGARLNLGLALDRLGRITEAARAFRAASLQRPDDAAAMLRWLRAAGQARQPAGVAEWLSRPPPRLSSDKRLALEAAAALEDGGQTSAALVLLNRLRAESPNDAETASRLETAMRYGSACALEAQRRSDDAIAIASELLAAVPRHRGARLLRAELMLERADIDAAIADHALLAQAHPRDPVAASSRLIALQHSSGSGADAIATAHREWGRCHAEPVAPRPPARHKSGAPLRIGWISPRLSAGVVGTFFAAEFEALDRDRMRHFVYDDGSVEDAINARFRAAADAYRRIDTLDDGELAEKIRNDGIDVLVDLAGHSPGNRLRAFSARPAPVQASWLDYFHSTGSDAIDFFVTDAHTSPPQTAQRYSERLVYLGCGRLCYAPAVALPEPASRADRLVRFACFNRVAKINDAVLAAWAEILAACAGSVLRLKAGAFDDAQMRAHFLARCARHGIDERRLELRGYGTHAEALAAYADIDVALDTFPFSGCATSCDALAMGVPVVTLQGEAPAGRQTASLLAGAGLEDWIARDRESYVRIACALAADTQARYRWRAELPARRHATFGDVARHARALSAALQAMWDASGDAGRPQSSEPLRIDA